MFARDAAKHPPKGPTAAQMAKARADARPAPLRVEEVYRLAKAEGLTLGRASSPCSSHLGAAPPPTDRAPATEIADRPGRSVAAQA